MCGWGFTSSTRLETLSEPWVPSPAVLSAGGANVPVYPCACAPVRPCARVDAKGYFRQPRLFLLPDPLQKQTGHAQGQLLDLGFGGGQTGQVTVDDEQ